MGCYCKRLGILLGNNSKGAGWSIRLDDGREVTTTNVVFDESSRYGREDVVSVRPGIESQGIINRIEAGRSRKRKRKSNVGSVLVQRAIAMWKRERCGDTLHDKYTGSALDGVLILEAEYRAYAVTEQ